MIKYTRPRGEASRSLLLALFGEPQHRHRSPTIDEMAAALDWTPRRRSIICPCS